MVNCPECGKSLKKKQHKAKYFCENNACSIIFIRHPDKPPIMEITYKSNTRPTDTKRPHAAMREFVE